MPFFDGCELIGYAMEAEREDRYFLRWLVMYQDRMGFEEFKQKLEVREEDDEEDAGTVKEILRKVKGIIG